ncbi:MAG: hypothetical protein ABR589_00780 [Chthoniobacterales bacterium]
MFPLHTKTFPPTSAELAQLLNQSLSRVFFVNQDPVSLRGDFYPELELLDINLDRAKLRPKPPRPPAVSGARTAALQVRELRLKGSQLTIGPANADLRLRARDVRLDQARDSAEEIVLVLQSAAQGEVELSTRKSELEAAIAALASHEAGKQGVTIEDVSVTLRDRGPRSVSGEVQLKARKLFFSTVIRIAGNLDLDEQLNATVSGLTCKGDGAIGTLACGVLSPHLQKLNGRTFPLMALPLGDVRLRDVRISAADVITISAEFGA